MILGVLPNLGDSFVQYKKSGRDSHWEHNYLTFYEKEFRKIYFFSYAGELNPYPGRLVFWANNFGLSRFLYSFLLPFLHWRAFTQCDVIRVRQVTGVVPAIIAKILWGKPILATYGYDYCLFASLSGQKLQLPFIRLLELMGLYFSDQVIVTNDQIKNKVVKMVNPKKIVLLPNGVDVDLFKPAKVASSKITILNIGRLVKQKNQLNLIKAVSRLADKQKYRLIIVGNGRLEVQLRQKALKEKISLEIISSKNYQDMPEIYNQADIFVLPSLAEGSPKVLLEAMACGLPCIATQASFASFIIDNGKNGLLCRPGPKSIASCLQRIIDNQSLRDKLAASARKTIIQKFNNTKILANEIEILKKIVKQS